jgi:hypothetical protein
MPHLENVTEVKSAPASGYGLSERDVDANGG